MDDICRNNRVNRSEVIVDVTYRREMLVVFAYVSEDARLEGCTGQG